MAEELYFIKTNPTIAKINLYNKLCREEKNVLNFLSEDKKTSFELIKTKIKDSVENLTKEELLQIFSWFDNEYKKDREEVKTQLFINGIDLFYEIPSTVDVVNFQQILSDYENYSKQKLNHLVDVQHFNQFLIYGIFYTGIKNQDKDISVDMLKQDYKNLYSFAENQFSSNGKIFENENFVLNIYNYFTDLYDLTKYYKGSIIKLHG
ncbi:hypothetical protein [Chryseobacterium limigenitum]|uniref:Uncharacterized protein n=1 Tax=Chryseobacterium limigenitum TaxID=1612149 RepID=A0A1K2II79_9FLAO|nr:hypothetical protein [Chryseobacterium limigenitum]SFZ92006.1 hypothetical protein SAMN05216324_10372 [Chryseobacterium limigenitum]